VRRTLISTAYWSLHRQGWELETRQAEPGLDPTLLARGRKRVEVRVLRTSKYMRMELENMG